MTSHIAPSRTYHGALRPGLGLALLFCACGGSPAPSAEAPAPKPTLNPVATPTAAPSVAAPSATNAGQGDCPAGMIAVEGGTLRMGSPDGQGGADEHPQTEIAISAFCIDASEVNLESYNACVTNSICDAPPESIQTLEKLSAAEVERRSALCTARFAKNLDGKQDLPVNCVNFDEAARFCKWKGGRLPTEAEFEWLATAGEDRLKYPWGNGSPDANKLCWSQTDGPCPAKSLPPQIWGVYDVVGNLAEWTSTTYAPYGKAAASGDSYSVRGGSWKSTKAEEVGGKRRDKRTPILRDVEVGFRCAKNR